MLKAKVRSFGLVCAGGEEQDQKKIPAWETEEAVACCDPQRPSLTTGHSSVSQREQLLTSD